MNLRIFFFVACLILCGRSACGELPAGSCASVRLDQAGGPLEKIPIYDQEKYSKIDSAICYAVAGSEIADADRFYAGDPLGKLTAPLSLALNYKMMPDASSRDQIGYGETQAALAASAGKWVCDQRALEKFDSVTGSAGPAPAFTKKFSAKGEEDPTSRFLRGALDEIERYRELRASLEPGQDLPYQACGPGTDFFRTRVGLGLVGVSDLERAVAAGLNQASPAAESRAFVEQLCRNTGFTLPVGKVNRFVPRAVAATDALRAANRSGDAAAVSLAQGNLLRNLVVNRATLPAENFQKVEELLCGAKPVPIAVDFNPGFMHKRGGLGRHSAVIAGQRCAGSSCEFLVRNSYGGCKGEDGLPRYVYPCENGSIWVPAEGLMQATFGLVWIPR